LLDEDHTKRNERPLANKINTVLGHRFQNFHGVLEAGTRAGNPERKGCTAPDMGVIALAEQLNYPRNLAGVLEEKEGEGGDSGTPDVIRSV
jgi:hypothetical protein